jgi:hypothetical protein
MTKHEVISSLKVRYYVHVGSLLSSFKRNLNYIRLYLNKSKNGNSILITHEQWVPTSFLGLDSLELILVKFP